MSEIVQINYLDLSSYPKEPEASDAFEEWAREDSHSNGYCYKWHVRSPDDSAHPKCEKYFMRNGFKEGDTILVHSNW